MKYEIKKKVIKPLCIYSLAFSMLLPSVASLADLDINLGGYSVVYAAAVPAPTINDVFIGATSISGGNLHRERVDGKLVRGTVHVTLKNGATVKAELSVTPKSGTTWTVDLPAKVTVAEGDTVTVYQQLGENKSPDATANAQPGKSLQYEGKLKMPTGEIFIEQYVAKIVNDDEQAEALDLLKKANPDIAKDIKSVEFSIKGDSDPKKAYYVVTYTDDSKTEEILAPDLKIKQVTETSRGATLGSITIVDNVIKGKLAGEGPFKDIKVQIVLRLDDKAGTFCNEGKCITDKNSSKPVDAVVDTTTGEFSYTINPNKMEKLELDQVVGVSIKEPHKFKSCNTTTVTSPIPEKTEVRDPKKLTEDDKTAIINAIKEAYIAPDGTSKLPNGTGVWDGIPAFIEFDNDGNARIIRPNDVNGSWSAGEFSPKKKADGSLDVKDESKVIKIPAKDLVKNIKPDAPTVALSEDKKNITITPKEVDTDATIITVSYKDKDGNDQTTTATKADDGTWSIVGEGTVENGVVTIPKNKVKSGTDVKATVTDKGGVADDDKTPLESDAGSLTIEETKADKVEALGGLDPVPIKKWVKDTVDWKDGVKAKDDAKKDEVAELLKGATFEDVTETKRSTDNSGDFTGKVKVKFDDDSEIIVDKQMLYVSDLVSPSDKENLPDDAVDVELKLGEGAKAGDKTGSKETPVTAKTYKVKPGTDLSIEKVSKTDKTCFEDVGAEVTDDTYVDVTWNDKDKGTNFKATAENNVFTATATKTFDVTVVPNGGEGTDIKVTKKTGETYKLPAKDTFTPPNDNQEFSGWMIGTDTTLKQAGDEITITSNTTVKAIWKPIEFKVIFKTEDGASGDMKEQTVTKGSEYEIPAPTFKPVEGKEFAGWKIEGQDGLKNAKDKIEKISGDVTLIATWKDIMVDVSYDANGGNGTMEGKTLKAGSKYTLLENTFTAPDDTQEFKAWEVDGKEVVPGTEITIKGNTVIKAVWKKIQAKVTYDANGGSGTMTGAEVDKGSNYTVLPNGFTAPDDTQEFKAWEVDGKEVAPGTEITIKGNTVIKAVWKKIQAKVTYDANGGSGTMTGAEVDKGSNYTVLPNGFTAPDDTQEFKAWEVDGKEVAPGTEITIKDNTVIKALWKAKTTTPEPGKPGEGETNPETPDPNKPGTEEPGKPGTKPENPSSEEDFIPGIKHKDHYTPTFPVYVTVPKTEEVEKVEEVPVSLETHKAYIAGYEDNTLRAEGNLTRAEAAAMVTRLAGLDLSDNSMPAFKDMQKNAWYFRYINAAVKANMLDADNGMMRPNDKITRAEFAKMLAAIDKENSSVSKFDDIKGHRYEKEINKIYGNNRIEGYEDGSFRPDAYLTRAESAAFLNRMFNRIADKEAYAGLEEKLAKFKDFDASKWYYDEMVEATNSHELTRRGKASDKFGRVYEKWTRILPSDVK